MDLIVSIEHMRGDIYQRSLWWQDMEIIDTGATKMGDIRQKED